LARGRLDGPVGIARSRSLRVNTARAAIADFPCCRELTMRIRRL